MNKQTRNCFNEATRVQMPALVHLTRLGYEYCGKLTEDAAGCSYDPDTNILIPEFTESFDRLNPEHRGEATEMLAQIKIELNNNDIGKSFYHRLTSTSPVKLIDFEHPDNNSYRCTAEFTYRNGLDEFRPDITLFVNGLPLVFVEVKKPNNRGGMVAESKRMNEQRFPNPKFRRFINITQLMIFSNNMEYDADGGITPIQGAFYCTGALKSAPFNCFREENPQSLPVAPYNAEYEYKKINPDTEKTILSDYNVEVIHNAQEYQYNLDINTPTNRILTSMCSRERLLYILKYGIAYIHKQSEDLSGNLVEVNEKHIMRYQQMFATMAIKEKLSEGVKSGIVWHTQGSGKTALSYYLTQILTDYYASQNIVTKFYFIVDRLTLLTQAKEEFEARGLTVNTVDNRSDLTEQFERNQSQEGNAGKREITVVNIQKFAPTDNVIFAPYATNLQRVFIVDEAHRGYKPAGCFLANLFGADRDAVKIALTGTPLLKDESASRKVFGNYYHTYYYDRSVEDGYTLKIIREDIETQYREHLTQVYDEVSVLLGKKKLNKDSIVSHENYVRALLKYIITDFKRFRIVQGDDTLGGMVVCETGDQARAMYAYFDEVQSELNASSSEQTHFVSKLIMYDYGDKDTRTQYVDDYKDNKGIDILIVYEMLLTGFDAPRLKRLYLGQKIKDHGLLQAITRVNRPYKDMHYGYVVDFADIKKNFDATNAEYLKELNYFNNPEDSGNNAVGTYAQVIEDKDALIAQMKEARRILLDYTMDNMERFNTEISEIDDKEKLQNIRRALTSARDCCNIVRTFGDDELRKSFDKMNITGLPQMIGLVASRIDAVNWLQAIKEDDTTSKLINDAMQEIEFRFVKRGEDELRISSGGAELNERWRQAAQAFNHNTDQDDEEYISIMEAFREWFKNHGIEVSTMEEYDERMRYLDDVIKKLRELQNQNDARSGRYHGDAKYMRVQKRISEENARRKAAGTEEILKDDAEDIWAVLDTVRKNLDDQVYYRNNILNNAAYFEQAVMVEVTQAIKSLGIAKSTKQDRVFIRDHIVREYMRQNA